METMTATQRLIAYGVLLAIGVGLLIYGVEVDVEGVRDTALVLIGGALGGAGLRQVKQ